MRKKVHEISDAWLANALMQPMIKKATEKRRDCVFTSSDLSTVHPSADFARMSMGLVGGKNFIISRLSWHSIAQKRESPICNALLIPDEHSEAANVTEINWVVFWAMAHGYTVITPKNPKFLEMGLIPGVHFVEFDYEGTKKIVNDVFLSLLKKFPYCGAYAHEFLRSFTVEKLVDRFAPIIHLDQNGGAIPPALDI